jgi:hypothetical protein
VPGWLKTPTRVLVKVCLLMRKVNSDSASMNVYLWSLPPVSAPPSYHKILGAVKTETTTATSWGWGRIYGIVEMTKGKLLYCPAGILHNNDIHNDRRNRASAREPWRERRSRLALRLTPGLGALIVVRAEDHGVRTKLAGRTRLESAAPQQPRMWAPGRGSWPAAWVSSDDSVGRSGF